MGREFELKYRADAAVLEAVREKFGGFKPIEMETAYFDTPNGELREKKWMLRRRMENGVPVCTLKTPLPDGSRGEWEVECGTVAEAVPELCKLGAPEELKSLAEGGFEEVCAARLVRLASTIKLKGCVVEIALDQGVFLGGGKEAPFSELEVELKAGSEEAAREFAEGLAREFGLAPEKKSKVQRAMALAGR